MQCFLVHLKTCNQKNEETRSLGNPMHRWENFKMDLEETGCVD